MTNAQRFINAYNLLDKAIRNLYGIKGNLGFSEMIRQTSLKNALLKHYKDELYDYSRLRNAIVHNAVGNDAIAEPHTDVVEKLEYILEQVRKPRFVIDVLRQEKVMTVNATDSLQTFLVGSAEDNFTHKPVYDDGKVVGIINPKQVTEAMGEELLHNGCISKEYLMSLTVGRIMTKRSVDYIFESSHLTVVQAVTHFQNNRRLKAILMTEGGDRVAPVLRIITASDAVEFQKQIF